MLLVRSQNGVSIWMNIRMPVTITVSATMVTAQCMPFCSNEYLPGFFAESNGSPKSPGPRIIDLKSCQNSERMMWKATTKVRISPEIQ